MSIKIITYQHLQTIKDLFENTKNSISIISPFIGNEMANLLCQAKEKNNDLKVTLITRYYREDFIQGFSKIYSLEKLLTKGIKILALKDLHTKLYLFDIDTALVGSANFTLGGFHYNHELSLLIENENDLNKGLKEFFEELVNRMIEQGNCVVTEEQIKKEILLVNQLLENMANQNTTYSNTYKYGADIKKLNIHYNNESSAVDIIQEIVQSKEENPKIMTHINANDDNIWLKFEESSSTRVLITQKYRPTILKENGKGITCFPKGKTPNIKEDDFVYIAVVSKDTNGKPILPYIVGRGILSTIYDATPTMIIEHHYIKHYSKYCNLKEFEYLNTPIENCIPLSRILMDIQEKTYLSTKDKKLTFQELRIRHHQKSHIHLTRYAKSYIDELFNELTIKYGSKKI